MQAVMHDPMFDLLAKHLPDQSRTPRREEREGQTSLFSSQELDEKAVQLHKNLIATARVLMRTADYQTIFSHHAKITKYGFLYSFLTHNHHQHGFTKKTKGDK